MELVGVAVFAVVLLLGLSVIVTFVVLGIVLIKALIRYIRSKDVRKETMTAESAAMSVR